VRRTGWQQTKLVISGQILVEYWSNTGQRTCQVQGEEDGLAEDGDEEAEEAVEHGDALLPRRSSLINCIHSSTVFTH
jgi:hypothetical protein